MLLAEDEDLLAELLQAQLAPLGCQVERAGNGHLALALLKRLPFEILLVDLQLPGLDGHEVVRALREHECQQGLPRLPRLPVLALLAHARADDAHASLAAGCDEHLAKPVSQVHLMAALRRWAPAQSRVAATTSAGPAASPYPAEDARRRAHAAVFLGHWDARWTASRGDPVRARALLADLRGCAEGLSLAGLLSAGATLADDMGNAKQAEAEAETTTLQREIEALLPALSAPAR